MERERERDEAERGKRVTQKKRHISHASRRNGERAPRIFHVECKFGLKYHRKM